MTFDTPTAEEYALIFDSWARCWMKSPWAGCIRNCDYDTTSRAMISELIDRAGTRVTVLYTVTDDGIRRVVGYTVSEPAKRVIHWVYVKRDFRGLGNGRRLLHEVTGGETKGWLYTHKTNACEKFLRGMKHDPARARVKA